MDLNRKSMAVGRRPALILVDLIKAFTDPQCALGCDSEDVVKANKVLLDFFREADLPRFFTTVAYHNNEQASIFRARVPALNILKAETKWVAVDERLHPKDSEEVIVKHWASAFFKTDLAEKLEQENADSLVITGLTTSGCVRATVVDGLQHDYPVFVPKEAVGDRNAQAHTANLFDMHAKYADVLSLSSLLAKLEEKVLAMES